MSKKSKKKVVVSEDQETLDFGDRDEGLQAKSDSLEVSQDEDLLSLDDGEDSVGEIGSDINLELDGEMDGDVEGGLAAVDTLVDHLIEDHVEDFVADELAPYAEPMDESTSEVLNLEPVQVISIIESLLFATDKPLSFEIIRQAFKGTNIKSPQIRKAIEEYRVELLNQNRGVELQDIAGGFQLRTKSDNVDFLRRSVKNRVFKLSGPALEVLAIVAYKQPIIKSQIDEIRGVDSGHLLRALMDRGLVKFGDKSELPGRPMYYETAKKFLEIFGLRNLKELPSPSEIDELIPEGIGDPGESERNLGALTSELSVQAMETYSQGENELLKISDELSQIKTTTDFFEQEQARQKSERERLRAQDIREAIIMSQAVEEKDLRWLERYEKARADLAAKSAAAAAAELMDEPTVVEPDHVIDEVVLDEAFEVEAVAIGEVTNVDVVVAEGVAAEAVDAADVGNASEVADADNTSEVADNAIPDLHLDVPQEPDATPS